MPESRRLSAAEWLICVIAVIGFAYDTYSLLVLPLIIRPALLELGGITPGTSEFARWFGLLFYVPAVFGGIFGLLGGYLTDRFGRRRVLTWSILIYAISTFASGYATSLWMLLALRCTTFIGVCVEFVAAVAWLAELFDDSHRREKVLGYTQAFSSFGGILVAVANGLVAANADKFFAIHMPSFLEPVFGQIAQPQAVWRYTLMSGIIPAIPLIIIRPFLPESPKWAAKRAAGTLRRPTIGELFSPELRRSTIVATVMFAGSFGVAFGALQQMQQIVPGIDTAVAKADAAAAERSATAPPDKAKAVAAGARGAKMQEITANYTKAQEIGGLFGRFALAMLVTTVASRRSLLRIFLVPGMFLVPLVFWGFSHGHDVVFFSFDMGWLPGFHEVNVTLLGLGIAIAGFFTIAQLSFWGNYLPHIYPVHLRGTGESFAANIGGRMFGTPFAYLTQLLALVAFMPGTGPPAKTAIAAAIVAFVLFLMNLILTPLLTEHRTNMSE